LNDVLTTPGRQIPATLQSAIAAYRRGEIDQAVALAGRHVGTAGSGDFSGHAVMGEVLFRAARIEELLDFLSLADDFLADPRGQLLHAKALRRAGEISRAEALLQALVNETALADAMRPVQRMAAFELSALLEQQGRHDAAWSAAAQAHKRAGRAFPVDQLVEALRVTAQASAVEILSLPRASKPAGRAACILGMPRSGTTLLEQMLDRHAKVVGAGELPLPGQFADTLARAGGGWPVGALHAPIKLLNELQKQYLWETRGRRKLREDTWTLDKTVFPMQQPLVIAGVLPGAKVLRIRRDARDNAVSLFMNNFDPSWAWTASLDGIRRVLQAERQYMPVILEKLRIDVLDLRFEDLVDQPETTLRQVFTHLGLEWEPACLQPQDNQRLVFTLSHEQVRKPLNRQGIGRWQAHAARFDAAWEGLV
jgi:tetratricopeptide (TPR) repeat protein